MWSPTQLLLPEKNKSTMHGHRLEAANRRGGNELNTQSPVHALFSRSNSFVTIDLDNAKHHPIRGPVATHCYCSIKYFLHFVLPTILLLPSVEKLKHVEKLKQFNPCFLFPREGPPTHSDGTRRDTLDIPALTPPPVNPRELCSNKKPQNTTETDIIFPQSTRMTLHTQSRARLLLDKVPGPVGSYTRPR